MVTNPIIFQLKYLRTSLENWLLNKIYYLPILCKYIYQGSCYQWKVFYVNFMVAFV